MKLKNLFHLYSFKDLDDAHHAGFMAGFIGEQGSFVKPVNKYQHEFNRGHKSGEVLSLIRHCRTDVEEIISEIP